MDLAGVSLSPIVVTVGEAATCIDCSASDLHEPISLLFRHCTADPDRDPTVRFSIARTPAGYYHLARDAKRLYEGDDLDYLSHLLVHQMMTNLIRGCVGGLCLHSAALACDGSGMLLCGESASGKSTLSAWLTAAGFDYLTDELTVVDLDGSTMTGLVRSIMLRRGSAFVLDHWLGEDVRPTPTLFARNSIAVDPEILRPASVCRHARPKTIIFPRHAPGEALVGRHLSAAESARRLMQVATNAARLPDSGIPAVLALARSTQAFTLDYPDAESAAAWIETRVAG